MHPTFGIYIENLHPADADLRLRLHEHREQVRLARDSGFASAVIGQHFLTYPIKMPAAIPHLAALASDSGEMRLALGVLLLPLLNPVQTAEEIATLDWLTDGRLILGIGLGYRDEEFAAFGVPKTERVARFNEALGVMRAMWSANGQWSFEGKYYNYSNLPSGMKPQQAPHPPLWIAADVDAAVRRAARLGAAWYINPRAALGTLKKQLTVYQAALDEYRSHRPELFPIRREAIVSSDRAQARRLAVQYLRKKIETYRAWGQLAVMPESKPDDVEFDETSIPEAYFVGTPEEVAERVAEYNEAIGVNHFVFRVQWAGMSQRDVLRSIDQLGAVVSRYENHRE